MLQILITLNIFKKKHLNSVVVLVFDQSSTHVSHREGALNAFNINLNDRGKKPTPKDTYYLLECIILELRGTIQSLYTINQNREKVNKGIKTIL
jgi:hypothetical protein